MIVACWSGPRNISTALMRSWSSRKDTFVSDEPLYAYYLKETPNNHPMREEIINYYETDYEKVITYLLDKIPDQKTIWYQKHMAHHLINIKNIDWIIKCENCILLRHPKEVISSFTLKNNLQNVKELGYPQQFEIVQFLQKSNRKFTIIETEDLLNDPKNILSNWCKNINIDFVQSMLSWKKGVHQYDGIWWEYWYDNVIKTTGFLNYQKKDISIENKYVSIYNESMEYYNYLKSLK